MRNFLGLAQESVADYAFEAGVAHLTTSAANGVFLPPFATSLAARLMATC